MAHTTLAEPQANSVPREITMWAQPRRPLRRRNELWFVLAAASSPCGVTFKARPTVPSGTIWLPDSSHTVWHPPDTTHRREASARARRLRLGEHGNRVSSN